MDNIIFIDNFDSFTYNLVDEIKALGYHVEIYRNDVTLEHLDELVKKLQAQGGRLGIVLSPGPSTPQDANNLMPIVNAYLGRIPLLGVCLGHQALGLALGGRIGHAKTIVHGKSSLIEHNGHACFKGLASPLQVARSHSLSVEDIEGRAEVLSSYDGMCMALYSAEKKALGMQFHPESIMTTYGRRIIKNALDCLL